MLGYEKGQVVARQTVIFLLFFSFAWAEVVGKIERRRDQYLSEPGYFVAPAPYSIPGIGTGLMVVGIANNIYDSQTDVLGYGINGDVSGYGFAVTDWYLIDKHLKLEMVHTKFDKASFQSYSSRGMESDKNEYVLVSVEETEFSGFRATASFWDKMLEFYSMAYLTSYGIDSIRDKEGDLILEASDMGRQHSKFYILGFMADYTDDRLDPRRGVRFDTSVDYSPPNGNDGADFYQHNYNFTAYIPLGKRSSWVFNYYRSDANVLKRGETDYDTLASQMGLDCTALTDLSQKQECESVINNTIAANKYGTATSLGGRSRLRSYPEGRFSGAHTQFYGTEFRWNITEETTPFDIGFMKDVRTGIQVAFFYERGSVAERIGELNQNERYSYGTGVRMVTASGLVYRLDGATGDEGFEMTVIINYPWEIF